MNRTAQPQPPLRSFFVLLFLGVCLLTLALVVRSGMLEWRHPSDVPINSAMRYWMSQTQPELTTQDNLKVDALYPTAAVASSGLRFLVRRPGHGPKPVLGDFVTVRYAGRLFGGTEVDSTYRTPAPLTYRLGSKAVLPGLNQAFLDMRRGEKRTLILPYWLAYGVAGKPPAIPPKATIIYEAELIDFFPQPGGAPGR